MGRALIERTRLRPYLVASAPTAGVLNVREAKNVPLPNQNEERVREIRSFDREPISPSVNKVDTDVIHTFTRWNNQTYSLSDVIHVYPVPWGSRA